MIFKKPTIVLLLLSNILINIKSYALDILINDKINTNIYGSFECGMTNNRALYSTFGFERQILTCTEAIIGLKGNFLHSNNKNKTFFIFEFAPIYNSIKMDKYRGKYVYKDINSPATGEKIPIYGDSEYVNWYKNQGSRMYYLEDYPIREMYIGISFFDNNLKFSIGRMKNLLSFDEQNMIWQEDAWFAPIAFWISKDIYTGIRADFNFTDNFEIDLAIYSGDGNPTKNWIYYLNNSGSPNKKSNNTPTLSLQTKLNFNIFNNINNSIFLGIQNGTIGSTWDNSLQEGKHNKNIIVAGFESNYKFNDSFLENIKIYFQYTRFVSGLRTKGQESYLKPPLAKDIIQNGIFTGFDINIKNIFVFGFTYEIFDRYDYMAHVYSYGMDKGKKPNKDTKGSLDKFMDSKQQSFILNFKYFVNKYIYFDFAAHFLNDPLNWVSEVLPEKGSNRYKISLNVRF